MSKSPELPKVKHKKIDSLSKSIDDQQRKSFLKFINFQIKEYDRSIKELKDLSTGVDLFYLLKALLNKKGKDFKIFNKMETRNINTALIQNTNVQMLLEYLVNVEKIPLYGITGPSIVGKDEKIILGLIWRIIRHFFMEESVKGAKLGNIQANVYREMVDWLNAGYVNKSYKIKKLDDWKTGRPLFELLNSFLFLSKYGDEKEKKFFEENSKLKGEELIQKCIDIAHEKFNIPKLMDPEDFRHAEKLSLCTYLNFFKKEKAKVKDFEDKMVLLDETWAKTLKDELEKLTEEKEEEKRILKEEYEKKIAGTIEKWENRLKEKQEEMESAINETSEKYEERLKEKDELLNSSLNEKEKELCEQVQAKDTQLDEKDKILRKTKEEHQNAIDEKEKEMEKMKEEYIEKLDEAEENRKKSLEDLEEKKEKEFKEYEKERDLELENKIKEDDEILKNEKENDERKYRDTVQEWSDKYDKTKDELVELQTAMAKCHVKCVIQ